MVVLEVLPSTVVPYIVNPPLNHKLGKHVFVFFPRSRRKSLQQGKIRWKRTTSRKQIDRFVPARDVTPWFIERSVSPENAFSSLELPDSLPPTQVGSSSAPRFFVGNARTKPSFITGILGGG